MAEIWLLTCADGRKRPRPANWPVADLKVGSGEDVRGFDFSSVVLQLYVARERDGDWRPADLLLDETTNLTRTILIPPIRPGQKTRFVTSALATHFPSRVVYRVEPGRSASAAPLPSDIIDLWSQHNGWAYEDWVRGLVAAKVTH